MITDKLLRSLKKNVDLDAGYNNIALRAGKVLTIKTNLREVEMFDRDIEVLIEEMAKEIIKLRKEVKRLS